ncbi:MAG: hypothetical protein ACYST2_00960 [Planctomycetota bacterium]|jgi:hypothetical protein
MDFEVVYKPNPDEAQKILDFLREKGFHPVRLYDGDPKLRYLVYSGLTVNIAVPKDEAHNAKYFLVRWEEARQKQVAKLIPTLKGQFFLAFLITIVVMGLWWFFVDFTMESVVLLFGVWIISFIVIANAEKLMMKLRSIKKPRSKECLKDETNPGD